VSNLIYVVGVGSGDPELITIKAFNVLKKVDVIAGWRNVVDRFDFLKMDGKQLIYLNYKEQEIQIPEIVSIARDRDVAVLFHGDPMVSDYQFLNRIKRECNRQGIQYVIISGISSVLRALAIVGKDLSQIVFITFHVRGELNYDEIKKALEIGRDLLIVPEPYPDGVRKVSEKLLQIGCNPVLTVMERLSFPDEKVYKITAEDVVKGDLKFSDLIIVHVPNCLRNS